jgi:uncharacterized protein with ParB-like and HNH nuclease domain
MPDLETVDFGDDPTDQSTTALEKKYSKQMREIVSQKIDLPISTLPSMIKDQINLNPDFQRRGRWDRDQQSRFIESIIMNVPVPPVFLGEDQYGMYVVLDGRQRLTAINEFLKNNYRLKSLEVWSDLNEQNFDDLQKKRLDKMITRRFVPAIIVLKESSPQVKYDVFDRLNTGGVIADPMEIRNAVFQGEFNKLLRALSETKVFRQLWEIPPDPELLEKNSLYRKMEDLELVLRFFALFHYDQMDMNYKDYLSDFMDSRNALYRDKPRIKDQDHELFTRAITNSWEVFRDRAFRKPLRDGKESKKSAPLADAVMISLAEADAKAVQQYANELRKAFTALMTGNEEFKKAIATGTNGKGAIRTRIELARGVVSKILP